MGDWIEPLAASFGGAIGGGLIVVVGQWARERFGRPRLRIAFCSDDAFNARTQFGGPDSEIEGVFLRARVVNDGRLIARSCRAYLTELRPKDQRGVESSIRQMDALALRWSLRSLEGEVITAIDLPAGINQYVDLFFTKSDSAVLHPAMVPFPHRFRRLISKPGSFRAKIVVVADNARRCEHVIAFEWQSSWDSLKARGTVD